jgi:hypothetical protein
MCVRTRAGRLCGMTSDRGALTALHLFLVWAAMAATMPALGFTLVVTAWDGGAGSAVPVLALGAPLMVGLLTLAGIPARTVVPLCGSVRRRLGWAVLVFALGTLGVLAGLAAYSGDVDLGSAGTRVALTGVPYAVAAALFVPSRWVRLGAVARWRPAWSTGASPVRRRRSSVGTRRRSRATGSIRNCCIWALRRLGCGCPVPWSGPPTSVSSTNPVREGYELGYVGLVVRSPLTRTPQCPKLMEKHMTCTVDVHGEMRVIRRLSGGTRDITLIRRHHGMEVEVTSQSLDEPGLRRLLNTLHRLSNTELERLMREKAIAQGY